MTDSLFNSICEYIEKIVTELARHKSPRPNEWYYIMPNELKIALRKAIDAGLFENKSCN